MSFRTLIAALVLSIVSVLLLASALGLWRALLIAFGIALLGLIKTEIEKAKRAKGRHVTTDE
jgi:hypothetical protein